jgi:hypothetical protein
MSAPRGHDLDVIFDLVVVLVVDLDIDGDGDVNLGGWR